MGILFAEKSLLTFLQGGSFGQRLFKLKVIDSQTGSAPTPARIALRTLMVLLVIPALFTHDGRRVHDIISRTIVVKNI